MQNRNDVQVIGCSLYFLPIQTRVPLKFGPETLTHVTCARVLLTVQDQQGNRASGWGETPLSVQWVWPCSISVEVRLQRLQQFCKVVGKAWVESGLRGHPMHLGHVFQSSTLQDLLTNLNRDAEEPMPWLAALLCLSPFDLALHDAYGNLVGKPVFETYSAPWMTEPLETMLQPVANSGISFAGKYPADFLISTPPHHLVAWHLVGGMDPVDPGELTGEEPDDGYPVLLSDWIDRDGLKCLKIKLRGTDPEWDYQRLLKVGQLALAKNVFWLSADFNCTVKVPSYVNEILDRLCLEHPRIYGMILYVEQPFPYDLEEHSLDVHSVSARKPLFLDESAHDWTLVKMGRELGWTGVALKTCKTQTGALLSACWAKAHGMSLMVQDLTNPMLAQIPHVLLAAQVGTIMGVETNAMQFYPDASIPEQAVHPGLYQRRQGRVDLSSLHGSGFGYRVDEIKRELSGPAGHWGEALRIE